MAFINLSMELVLLLVLLRRLVQLVDGRLQLHLEAVHLLPIVSDANVSLDFDQNEKRNLRQKRPRWQFCWLHWLHSQTCG